jgi:hypothetical protein
VLDKCNSWSRRLDKSMQWIQKMKRNKAEEEFALLLADLEWSGFKQDLYDHWDVKGVLTGATTESYRYDVKGMRRNSRAGTIDPDITWIESKNTRGQPGWVHGKADYIAFEQPNIWVIVGRELLLDFMRKKIDPTFVDDVGDALYKLYQRKGRRDVISKARMSDMRTIATWEIERVRHL